MIKNIINKILNLMKLTNLSLAFNFGINAYLSYPLFDFEKFIEEMYDVIFDGLPSNMFITDIKYISYLTMDNSEIFDRKYINVDNLLARINDK